MTEDPSDEPSDYERLKQAHRNFKLLAARLVAVAAAIYGAVTWKPYFLVLGIAAVVLFSVWDRMIAADQTSGDQPKDDKTGV
jgi:hypothetical protein